MGEIVLIRYCKNHRRSFYEECLNCSVENPWLDVYQYYRSQLENPSLWDCQLKLKGPRVMIGEDPIHYPDKNWVWKKCPSCVKKPFPISPDVHRHDMFKYDDSFKGILSCAWKVYPYEPWWEPSVTPGYKRLLIKASTMGDTLFVQDDWYAAYDQQMETGHPLYEDRKIVIGCYHKTDKSIKNKENPFYT
ncbi:hypothetical protein C4577_02050 [Candidatus Parcubacteria bacterium]|nr:MAG: hypothetical protein C4577_02050 [Candidatus Parcubacteria bacterium]